MADSAIQVTIRADTTDLNTKLALASAAVKQTSAELAKAGKAAVQTGADMSTMLPVLTQLAAANTNAKVTLAALTTGHQRHAEAVGSNRMAMMEFEHSARSVTDALAAGASPLRVLEMEGGRLVQAFSELSPAMQATVVRLAAIVGPAGLVAAGLGFVAMKAIEAEHALTQLGNTTAMAGRSTEVLTGATSKMATDLAAKYSISVEAAAKLAGVINTMPEGALKTRQGLLDMIPAIAAASGDTADKVAENLGRAFRTPSSLHQFAADNGLLTGAVDQTLAHTKTATDIFAAQGVVLEALQGRLGAYSAKLADYNKHSGILYQVGAAGADEGDAITGNEAMPRPSMPKLADTAPDGPSQATQQALDVLDATTKYTSKLQQVNDLLITQRSLQQAAAAPGLTADQRSDAQQRVVAIGKEITETRAGGTEMEVMQGAIDKTILESKSMSATARLAVEDSYWTKALQRAEAGGADEVGTVRQITEKLMEIKNEEEAKSAGAGAKAAKATTEEYVDGIRDRQAAETDNLSAQIVDEAFLLSYLKEKYGERSTQFGAEQVKMTRMVETAHDQQRALQVQTDSAAITGLDKQETADLEHVQRLQENGDTTIRAAQRAELEIVQAHQTAALAILDIEAVAAKGQVKLEKDIADQRAAIIAASGNKVVEINDQTTQRLMAQDKQVATSAASGIMGMLQGRRTFAQTAIQLGDQLIEHELAKGIESVLNAVRIETVKTGAAAAGTGSRLAVQASGAAAGKAIDAATGSASVMADAHKAFAGAYAAVSGIPVIGPVLAPFAGAAAFAAVAAMDVFSSAGGMEAVPYDGAPFLLHKNETVLPARVAQPLMAMARLNPDIGRNGMISAGGAPGGSSFNSSTNNGGDTHNHFSPNISLQHNGPLRPGDIDGLEKHLIGTLKNAHRNGAFR